jgi:NAD(P)-dependent dehydrogenase (short-subunit alcohol dehydrogenase family)
LTDIDALAARVKAEFGAFDLLFVNAGFGLFAPLENTTEAIYDEMFNLNAKGAFFAVQKLAPLINRGGSVVLTTSVANVKGMPGLAAYGAAKAALRSFARVFAAELLPREIRVNAVTPGPIDTPILNKAFPAKDVAAQVTEQMRGLNPMKRLGTSEEVAKAVLFLAFDATFTTGALRRGFHDGSIARQGRGDHRRDERDRSRNRQGLSKRRGARRRRRARSEEGRPGEGSAGRARRRRARRRCESG